MIHELNFNYVHANIQMQTLYQLFAVEQKSKHKQEYHFSHINYLGFFGAISVGDEFRVTPLYFLRGGL